MPNKKIIFILVALILLLPGCWDRQEVDQITFPLAIGVDIGSNGNDYVVYAQISQTKGPDQPPEYKVLEGKGETINRSFVEMASKTEQYISWQHVKAVVIREQVARKGLRDVYDALDRFQDVRAGTMYTLVTSSSIKDLFQVMPTAQTSLSTPFQGVQLVKNRTTEAMPVMIRDFIRQLNLKGADPVQGRVELVTEDKNKNLRFEGAVAFKKDKMVGSLDKHQTAALIEITDHVGNCADVVPCPGHEDKMLTFYPLNSNSQIKPQIEGDKVSIKLRIDMDFALIEETCPLPINNDTIKLLEQALSRAELKYAQETVAKAQKEFAADIFGFGEKVRRTDRKYWREHKSEWDNIFPDVPVEIEMHTRIRRTGKITNSTSNPDVGD